MSSLGTFMPKSFSSCTDHTYGCAHTCPASVPIQAYFTPQLLDRAAPSAFRVVGASESDAPFSFDIAQCPFSAPSCQMSGVRGLGSPTTLRRGGVARCPSVAWSLSTRWWGDSKGPKGWTRIETEFCQLRVPSDHIQTRGIHLLDFFFC